MNIWEKTFATREWGEYPPEELVRSAKRHRKKINSNESYCLELGCGPGANAKLLTSVFENYYAIDLSKSAIGQLRQKFNCIEARNIVCGSFTSLPWGSGKFDYVCDNFSTYANNIKDIKLTVEEVARVMKPGSIFYSRVWGNNCFGLNKKFQIDDYTYDNLVEGPCAGYGISTFFDLELIASIYGKYFTIVDIQNIKREYYTKELTQVKEKVVEEYIVQATLL